MKKLFALLFLLFPSIVFSMECGGTCDLMGGTCVSMGSYSICSMNLPVLTPKPTPTAAPTSSVFTLNGSCNSNGTISLSWSGGPTTTYYGVRIDDISNNSGCSGMVDNWYCPNSNDLIKDNVTGNSYSYQGISGKSYHAWVQPIPAWTPSAETSFSCQALTPTPTPSPTVTPTTNGPVTIIDIPLILNDGKSRWYRFVLVQ